jgi:hypothetical protein
VVALLAADLECLTLDFVVSNGVLSLTGITDDLHGLLVSTGIDERL